MRQMASKMSKKYAVVTTIQTFKHRYVISEDRLQSLNQEMPVVLEWADDVVTCEEIDEFSQKYMGETIIDTEWMEEDTVLKLFDKDNDYLSDWSEEQKLTYINHGLKLDKEE